MTARFLRDTLLTKPHPEPSSTAWQPCQSFGTFWRYLREATIIRLHKGQAIKKTNTNNNRKGKSPQESAKILNHLLDLLLNITRPGPILTSVFPYPQQVLMAPP